MKLKKERQYTEIRNIKAQTKEGIGTKQISFLWNFPFSCMILEQENDNIVGEMEKKENFLLYDIWGDVRKELQKPKSSCWCSA